MTFCRQQHVALLELLLRAMGTAGVRLDSTHFTQLNSFNSSHTTELTQLISLSVPHSTSLNSSDLTHLTQLPLNSSHSTHLNSSLSTHLTQVNSLNPSPPTQITQLITLLPPAPAQDYVQGAVLQMTGDEGAVLLCAEEHERVCPPPPLPRTMFKVQCFR